jgi:threonine dehydratase
MTDPAIALDTLPDFEDVRDAARQIAGKAHRTPLLEWAALNERAQGRVLIKPENLQRTGSFKFRGAYNRISRLDARESAAGVVAYSSGNHAQGVAAAAQIMGLPAVIVMPDDTPAIKLDNTRGYGAEIRTFDRATEDRKVVAEAIAAERGAVIVPPFDDPFVIAGQGTTGLELLEDVDKAGAALDTLLVPAGGGGLVAGINLAAGALSPETKVFSVEPEGFDDHARSLASGRRERNARGTGSICDALLAWEPGELTFAINARHLAGGLRVSDDEVRAAVAYAWRTLKLVLEPGGAVALAALLAGRVETEGRSTGIVLSGGNVDAGLYADIISAG